MAGDSCVSRKFTRRIASVGLVLALVLVLAPPAWADYEAGKRAWDEMRPAEALAQWQGAADDGDRRAMLSLGRLYATGLGAPQNYILAHVWFNLAASRGEAAALAERDALAAKMTPQQVAEAQERASSWRPVGSPEADTQQAAAAPSEAPSPPVADDARRAAGRSAARGASAAGGAGIRPRLGRRCMGSALRAGLPVLPARRRPASG